MTGPRRRATTFIAAVWPRLEAAPYRAALLVVAGVALLTLSAKLKVPFYPVPMTMQTLAVLVIGMAYGWRLGAATLLAYLAAGACGLPVFADTPAKGLGLAYMLGPTGGYLVGFVLAAALAGALAERGWDRGLAWPFGAMLIGHMVILACGLVWLAQYLGWSRAWAGGVAPFYLATVLKCALGAALMRGVWLLKERAAPAG